jgi:hypothetical protein
MRSLFIFVSFVALTLVAHAAPLGESTAHPTAASPDAQAVDRFFVEALSHGQAFENLRTLVSQSPGRLSGSKSLERAVTWAERTLNGLKLDRVYKQDVMVPLGTRIS